MEYKVDPYIMISLNQPNYQILTMPIDFQHLQLYNLYMGPLSPTNLDGTTNVSMPSQEIGTSFLMIELNLSPNLQIYQPNNQGMSLQMNNIIPPNPYMPNVNVTSTNFPKMNILNPNLANFGIEMLAKHTNFVQSPNMMITTPCIDQSQGKTMQNQSYLNQVNVIPNINNVQFQPIMPNLNIVQNQFVHDPMQTPQVYIQNLLEQNPNQGSQIQNQDQISLVQLASHAKLIELLSQEISLL